MTENDKKDQETKEAYARRKSEEMARLDRIEAKVKEIHEIVDRERKKEDLLKKKNSRATVTLAFGFIGMKVGALLATKVFAGQELIKWFKNNKPEKMAEEYERETAGLKGDDLTRKSFLHTITMTAKNENFLKRALVNSVIGSLIGLAVGGIIGWVRGDRLSHPDELFKHPIESLKKMFGPKPPPEPESTEISDALAAKHGVTPPTAIVERERQVTSAETTPEWRGKIAESKEMAAAAFQPGM